MATNTALTFEIAKKLLRSQPVDCPKCKQAQLQPRYSYKRKNTEYKCPACGEIYHPTKGI